MTTEIQRLLAEGSEVTFADGSATQLRYSAKAMAALEDKYGSLDAFLSEVGKASSGKVFHLLAFSLHVALGLPEAKVWDLIDTKRAAEYLTAITTAVAEALPGQEPGDKPGNAEATPEGPSPGVAGSTSPSSSGESTPTDSGK